MIFLQPGKKSGFTLIELLIVIAIIGILSVLAIVALGSARQKARDSKRVSDMSQISKALSLYYADNNSYPTLITPGQPIAFGGTTYLSTVPSNPAPWNDNTCPNQNYMYGSDNQRYTLYYCLGSDTGQVKAGYNIATASGVSADGDLVLRLDAGNSSSYPGTGTTWYDLSGKGNNGTLTNGPTYSSANSGSIVFDGTDDYVQLTPGILSGTSDFTIIAWINNSVSTASNATVFGNYPSGNMQLIWKSTVAPGLYLGTGAYSDGTNYSTGTIKQIVATRSGGSTMQNYVNAVVAAPGITSINSSIGTSAASFRIGANLSGSERFQGSIYQIFVYNRALSANEVLQNYNANRTRYGL